MKSRSVRADAGGFDDLTPAFSRRIADLITAEDDVKVVETLRGALDATVLARAPRAADGKNNYVEAPDWRVRVTAAKVLAEMKHGRPNVSIDMKVTGSLNAPMTRAEAARELL